MTNPLSMMDGNAFVLAAARGPLANMHPMDVMWVSFYSIAAMIISILMLTAARKWIKNSILSSLIRIIAFIVFLIGSLLMVLVIFTWPS
ncbi:DUF2768 domain-containing protein [Ureibacillus sp. FSL K6-8385]|uniref:DUF2768 domain-containing protein n=1 Tax=Ureibacillus terrenus TaxID=118246 RepID=A0A540V6P5_9BACL|nr:DUF2768 domain-containing protein [Ureibacillus terrenus]MED3660621.1 DUF2768 domain-containing protein [Ureibacillus terrenus]MED3762741.1 DUF2768 domain-containing protein [Ureibacillus terrenus]TQE92385.1 DUF2768 domain-containing protein [Ureibacillus terrenus]